MIQIDSNVREVLEKFHRLPGRTQEAVKRGLGRALILVEERVRTQTGIKWQRANSGLKGRLTSHVETVSDSRGIMDVDGVIGFRKTKNFPYELSQEFGAKAKPGKAMVIPLSDQAKKLSQRGMGPRDFPTPLFMPRGRKGRVLMGVSGSKKMPLLIAHYLLVKSIPPRLNFRSTIEKSGKVISEEVAEELGRVQP